MYISTSSPVVAHKGATAVVGQQEPPNVENSNFMVMSTDTIDLEWEKPLYKQGLKTKNINYQWKNINGIVLFNVVINCSRKDIYLNDL